MVIKNLFFAVLMLTVTVRLVDSQSQDGSVWGNAGPNNCDIRWSKSDAFSLCTAWPGPDIQDDPNFMRVFTLITSVDETTTTFRGVNRRCATLNQYLLFDNYWYNVMKAYKFGALCAERIAYANFFLVGAATEKNQLIKKGTFGPLYVGGLYGESLSWSETNKIPGYRRQDVIYAFYKFFVPELRLNFTDTTKYDYDSTLKAWLTAEPSKRDFKVAVSLSVTCRDNEKNCEPPVKNPDYEVLHSYIPKRNVERGFGFQPIIKEAYLDMDIFHFELTKWSDERFDELYIINRMGAQSSWVGACEPVVLFVLYDSNPPPHGHCDDDDSRWTRKNGEIRAVFAQFRTPITKYQDTQPPHLDHLHTKWDFNLTNSGWNENQLKFLAAWQQEVLPEGLDERDSVWYKGWRKATGMKVAFTYCTCGYASESRHGCTEYFHYQVDIRGRDTWLL